MDEALKSLNICASVLAKRSKVMWNDLLATEEAA